MLHHDLDSEETIPLPQRRITPDELQRAIAALDARRQEQERQQEEEARYCSETLSLEQATTTLSLDYTPEEVWAEVRQEREQAAQTQPETVTEAPTVPENDTAPYQFQHHTLDTETGQNDSETFGERVWSEKNVFTPVILGCVTIVGLLIGFSSCGQSGQVSPVVTPPYVQSYAPHYSPHSSPTPWVDLRTRLTTTLGNDFYAKLRQSQGPSPRYHITRVVAFPPGSILPSDVLYPERAIPDGYSVYERDGPSGKPAFGESAVVFRSVDDPDPAHMSPFYQASQSSGSVLITTRYTGQQYVRCWIRKADVAALEHDDPVTLYGTREAAPSETDLIPLTAPDNYWLGRGLSQGTRVTAQSYRTLPQSKIKLDSHAWEDYTTLTLPLYQPPDWAKIPGVFSDFADVSPRPFARYEELDASSQVKNDGQIADYHPFRCGFTILRELMAATGHNMHEAFIPDYIKLPKMSLSQVLVDVRPDLQRPYIFVKIDGNLYLRGWVETPMMEEQMRGHTIAIHTNPADPELGYSPTQIQLRLDHCQITPQAMSGGYFGLTIPVTDVHLDPHAWETWKS